MGMNLTTTLGKFDSNKVVINTKSFFSESFKKRLYSLAEILDEWMSEVLGLTAMFPGTESDDKLKTEDIVPPEGCHPQKPEVHPCAEEL